MEAKLIEIEYAANNAEMTTALVPYKDISIYQSKVKMKLESIAKRAIDIIGGLGGILILIPLTLVIFSLIKFQATEVLYFTHRKELEKMVKNLKCISFALWL